MKAGDTFALTDKAVDSHLWVIISDPEIDEGQMLFVSMTSYDISKEKVCLLGCRRPPVHPAQDLHRL